MKPKTILKLKKNSGFRSITDLIMHFQNKQSQNATYKPIGIELEITNQCNLRCSGCPIIVGGEKTEDTQSDEDILNVMRQAKKSHLFAYSVTGGEPFLEFASVKKIISNSHGLDLYKLHTNDSFFKTENLQGLYKLALQYDPKIKEMKVGERFSPCDVCQLLTPEIKQHV